MSTILLENIDTLATFDSDRTRLKDAWILIRDQIVESVGSGSIPPPAADRRLDLSGYVVLPGLINTHHHLFQSMLRNIPVLQDITLFPWLHSMYLLMSEVRDEDYYTASKINHAELLLSGCTTSVDHAYLKVNDMTFDTQIRAASEMGIRFHLARGSFSVGKSQGGLPPDDIVEEEDDILADTERLIKTYHDPKPYAMVRIDNAPCSPFSVSSRLMRESIEMARKYGVGNHTHLAECLADHEYMMATYGKRSVYMADEWGWTGPDVWYAHGVFLDDGEMDLMARTGTGVAHCPNSNMYTAAGICPVIPLLKKGAPVGLGVDGSAANNSSNMLREVRSALLLQRIKYGGEALSATQAFELALTGSARLLRRDDIGSIAPGKAADIIGIDTNKLEFAGGLHDPVAGLVFCDIGRVDLSIVNGKIRVQDGQLLGVDLPALIKEQNRRSAELVTRTEKRYNHIMTELVNRRAYPYQ
ncbi:MAG: 8-oxoguanine deaminase [Anaerolineaceae bacterium]|nr:8-oxoguanine deaminase [Anaerolineaceae bacterium]